MYVYAHRLSIIYTIIVGIAPKERIHVRIKLTVDERAIQHLLQNSVRNLAT